MSIPPISKRKQSRRAVSVSERSYQALKRYAASQGVHGIPLSQALEELINKSLPPKPDGN